MLSHRLILHALNKCLNLTPPVHKSIYSDHFIWYEKACLTCPMDLVSNRKSVICVLVQVSPASYEGQRYMTH